MSSRYYLPLRHDRMGKILYISHLQKHFPETKVEHLQEPKYIRRVKHMEYWRNITIKTATKIQHNNPDLIIWNHKKSCLYCRQLQLLIRLKHYKESCREEKQLRTTHSKNADNMS